ncbi:hypothetical protein PENARI_c001G08586 [Penicillium arizonense]|uniref:Bacteriophage T5 Orf172 DNA-binding domain-containing protein n=1 Tax=Penicillium arizonense TaxID=1835702 RepID=A0A1F5LWZ9_PENAI|nr:hypothetical protein PENARI_c001G08586 [Penicillium arizonense]OGE57683.1 hypothetical protein PENARI_c001G08586 [Penicillium arizonense]
MSAPPSPTINDVGVLPSSTRHFKKRNDDKIVFENQKPTALQEASPVRLNTVTTDQVNTEHAGLLATKSEKTPPGSVPRHRNKAGVKITKIQTISDTLHVDISSSTIKRKQNEVSHPGKTPGEASQMMVLTPSSPEDISLLSVFFRSSKTKRIRQTSSALWKLPIVSEINTEFSDPETILLGPQTARLYAVKQDPGSEETSRSQTTVTDDSEQLKTPTDRAGEDLPHEHKINSPLHQELSGSDNPGPEMQKSSSYQTFFSASPKPGHLQTQRTSTVENERLLALICWVRLLGRAALSQLSPSSFLQTAVGKIAQTELPPVNPIQDFKPYVNKGLSGTISEELAKLLTRPLKKSDIKYQGSMYIFSQRGNFGHLKIGRSGNVSRRLKQWNKQCKKTMEIYFPESGKNKDENMPDVQQVPHISRVEALVHLELYHHRRIEHKCPGCDKLHLEWFEVSKDIAIGVVRKWSAWMATLPYEKHMKDGEEQWILKSEEREQERLDKLCRPGITFSMPSLPVVKEEETLSSSPSTLASKCQVRGKGVGA